MVEEKNTRSFKIDPELDEKMIEFAETYYAGNRSRVIIAALKLFLQKENEKVVALPEELINSILFSEHLLIHGKKDEVTWDLLREEAHRACAMINLKSV